jgi:hypothetical protein
MKSFRLIIVVFCIFLNHSCTKKINPQTTVITIERAEQIAMNEISKLKPEVEYVIVNEKTITTSFGWVFFYNTKKYIETRDIKYLIPGNAPIMVNKFDGTYRFTGTSMPIDYYIDQYEKELHKK